MLQFPFCLLSPPCHCCLDFQAYKKYWSSVQTFVFFHTSKKDKKTMLCELQYTNRKHAAGPGRAKN